MLVQLQSTGFRVSEYQGKTYRSNGFIDIEPNGVGRFFDLTVEDEKACVPVGQIAKIHVSDVDTDYKGMIRIKGVVERAGK